MSEPGTLKKVYEAPEIMEYPLNKVSIEIGNARSKAREYKIDVPELNNIDSVTLESIDAELFNQAKLFQKGKIDLETFQKYTELWKKRNLTGADESRSSFYTYITQG